MNAAGGTVEQESVAAPDGAYQACVSIPGEYVVVFDAHGYDEQSFPIHLQKVSGNLQLDDEATAVPQTVALSETRGNVQTREATLRSIPSPLLVEALPIPGLRTFDDLAFLAAGVLPPPETTGRPGPSVSPGMGSAGQFAVNGLRSRDNNFNIDGSDNNDELLGTRRQGFVNLVPQPPESVEELQIITALGDSRFGRNIAGQINVLTKRGAREPHGELYDFFNDRRLNARNFFDNFENSGAPGVPTLVDGLPTQLISPPQSRAPTTLNQLGGTLGGPLPNAGYFFTSLERKILNAGENDYFAVPVGAQRRADTNEIPQNSSSLFPSSLPGDAIFSLFPFPNDPTGPYGTNTFATRLPASGRGTVFSGQVDHDITTGKHHHALTVRYNDTVEDSTVPVTGGALFSSVRPRLATQNLALFLNTNISAHLANSFRASYGRTSNHYDEVRSPYLLPSSVYPGSQFLLNTPLLLNTTSGDSPAGATFVSAASSDGQRLMSSLGLPSGTISTDQITGALGEVQIAGFSPLGVDTFHLPQKGAHHTHQLGDTLTSVHGRNVLTAGLDLRYVALNSSMERGARPFAFFDGVAVSGAPGGGTDAPSGFLSPTTLAAAGVPAGLYQTLAATSNFSFFPTRTQVDLSFQDEIRATDDLRFDVGFRLEVNGLPGGIQRQRLEGFNPAQLAPADFLTTFGHDRIGNDPRVGFAWDVKGNGRWAIRGGFGAYTGQFPMIILSESQSNVPYFLPLNLASFPSTVDGRYLVNLPNPDSPSITRQFGVIAPGSLSILNSAAAANPVGLLAGALSPLDPGLNLVQPGAEIKNPYALQYALTLEHQLLPDTVLSVAFVGTQGRKLLRVSTPDLGFNRASVDLESVTGLLGSQFPNFNGRLLPAQSTSTSQPYPVGEELWEGVGTSGYNSLQVELRRRYSNYFQFGSAFTYSKTLDDTSDFFDTAGEFALPQDSLQRSERGPASFDAPLRSVSYFVLDLPTWVGKSRSDGWQLSGVYTAQSGQPFTVNSVFDVNEDGNPTDRLNTTAGLLARTPAASKQTRLILQPGIDPESLLASRGSDGAVGRNTFRAQGLNDFDFSLTKTFRLSETHRLLARAEVFNGLNRTQFGIPVRILEFPSFGKSVSTTVPPRTIQLVLKYSF